MAVLEKIQKTHVAFDPTNLDHCVAAEMIMRGRQHPTIRFICDAKYTNVRDMVLNVLATQYIKNVSEEYPEAMAVAA